MGERASGVFISDLEREDRMVRSRVRAFAELALARQLAICCFYETKKTEMLRRVLPPTWARKLSSSKTYKIVSCVQSIPVLCVRIEC